MFKCIFLNENVWIPIEISLKFVPKGSINNNPAKNICQSSHKKMAIIGSDNGLSPGRRQAIIWTNDG